MSARSEISTRCVLVAGAGRSGTTWLGKLLDASPNVLYKHEPDNWAALPWFRDLPSRLDPGAGEPAHADTLATALEAAFWTHCLHFIRPPDFRKDFLRPAPWAAWNLGLRTLRKLGVRRDPKLRIPNLLLRQPLDEIVFVWKSVTSNLRLA